MHTLEAPRLLSSPLPYLARSSPLPYFGCSSPTASGCQDAMAMHTEIPQERVVAMFQKMDEMASNHDEVRHEHSLRMRPSSRASSLLCWSPRTHAT